MTVTREELLTAYAAGATSPGLSLLCAAHLTLSPEARHYVNALEEVGGALLNGEADAAAESAADVGAAMSFDALLAKIDADEDGAGARGEAIAPLRGVAEVDQGPLPRPVARALGQSFSDVPWKFRLPLISEHVISEADGEKISIMRAKPGARVPDHTHRGVEATLVLSGALQDGDRILTAGDIALCGPEHDHHPEIIGDEICYSLIVVDGKLRFTGRFGPALNLFAE